MLEECSDPCPTNLCTTVAKQRYALAVVYFSMGGDGWERGSNPGLDKSGTWLSGCNYCEWNATQVVCDQSNKNVLELHLGELLLINVPFWGHYRLLV